jgi:hypothetical protein
MLREWSFAMVSSSDRVSTKDGLLSLWRNTSSQMTPDGSDRPVWKTFERSDGYVLFTAPCGMPVFYENASRQGYVDGVERIWRHGDQWGSGVVSTFDDFLASLSDFEANPVIGVGTVAVAKDRDPTASDDFFETSSVVVVVDLDPEKHDDCEYLVSDVASGHKRLVRGAELSPLDSGKIPQHVLEFARSVNSDGKVRVLVDNHHGFVDPQSGLSDDVSSSQKP